MSQRAADERRIPIVQGEAKIASGEKVVMTTLLGSCVACCLHAADVAAGGMNHFLLPGDADSGQRQSESYGVYLMELLVNEMLKAGASRHSLKAKLFGGARTMSGLSDIGGRNAAFAKKFLETERIQMVGGDLGGIHGRRIEFWPGSGRVRQMLLRSTLTPAAVKKELSVPVPASLGELELF